MAQQATKGKGQKKVIKRIEGRAARDVCFSKRRKGLFNKANDLAIMCGAQLAAIVFSPAGKAYSYGHPSVEAVANRFLGSPVEEGAAGGQDRLEELRQEYNDLRAEMVAVEERKRRLEEAKEKELEDGSQAAAWLELLDAHPRDMAEADRLTYEASLKELQAAVAAALAAPPPQLLAGGGGPELGGTSANGGMGKRMTEIGSGGAFELGGTSANGGMGDMMTEIGGGGVFELGGTSANGGMGRGGVFELGGTSANGGMEDMMTVVAGRGGFELGCTSANGGMWDMMAAIGGGGEFELGSTSANGGMEEMTTMIGGGGGFELGGTSSGMEEMMALINGGGGFDLGCTSANGWMEETFHQPQMMTAMPQLQGLAGGGGFEFGGTSAAGGMYYDYDYEMVKQLMMTTPMPQPPWFADGMGMQQQQQMMSESEMLTQSGFAAGVEMQQQPMIELPVFAAGTEVMQQAAARDGDGDATGSTGSSPSA